MIPHHIIPGFLNPSECTKLVHHALQLPCTTAIVGHGGGARVDTDLRRSVVRWLDRSAPLWQNLVDRLQLAADRANSTLFGLDMGRFLDLQFTEYNEADEGGYDWHQDCALFPPRDRPARPHDRKLSMVLQLSNPTTYQGGELQMDQRYPLTKGTFEAQGTLILFPSLVWHKVTPVTQGVRYSLVAWVEGPRWR